MEAAPPRLHSPTRGPPSGPKQTAQAVNAHKDGHKADGHMVNSTIDIDKITQLHQQMGSILGSLKSEQDPARRELADLSQKMSMAISTPREIMTNHCWAMLYLFAAIGVGQDLGLWDHWKEQGDAPQNATDLAKARGCEPLLLRRLLKHISAMHCLEEVSSDVYKSTEFSKSLARKEIVDGYKAALFGPGNAFLKFPEFIQKRNFRTPVDPQDTALHFAYGTNLNFFEYLISQGHGPAFNNHMSGYREGRPPWTSFYPVTERLIRGADTSPGAPFLVDIGGNIGTDLERFQSAFPDHPGTLILQDTPTVIGEIDKLDSRIVRQSHDFGTAQPVAHARAYFLHSVLHDWPDAIAKNILVQIMGAMKPGYSKILINENVIPTVGAASEMTSLDGIMMGFFSAKERTVEDWSELISGFGLKVSHIWDGGKGNESVIEVELDTKT